MSTFPPILLSDPRVASVANAMISYDRANPEKTWRELAAVAVVALDQWKALNEAHQPPTPVTQVGAVER